MYRELHELDRALHKLGFPHQLPEDAFRSPNFSLMACCLTWLLHRVDPAVRVPRTASTEAGRMRFLHAALQAAQVRGRVRLNARRLYAADADAVPELLRLAALLQAPDSVALKHGRGGAHAASASADPSTDPGAGPAVDPAPARRLASELAAATRDTLAVLQRERSLRGLRSQALSLAPEEVERRLVEGASAAEAAAEAASLALDALAPLERATQRKEAT
ncbi:hypothetical protein WJX81_000375 [Elliptochloris bilobata]|uniref:Uncharacterized protein n=1 Tax=Elliptochloris bilobata TaxID=381761 RepID=A0AAW1QZG7_9CHLO